MSANGRPGRSAWERLQLARHPARPKTLDYVAALAEDWVELRGDRAYGDDPAMIAGIGRLLGRPVVIVGHQRGSDTRDNLHRNFGMPRPEAYRKARRAMELAGKFALPLVCLVDTPAADPGMGSEERGQAVAIALSLQTLANLPVPVVTAVIGEGGSGGALAIGAGDRILMLENAVYAVASPEACAAILWRDAGRAPEAAEALRSTAPDLLAFGIADEIVSEPAEGAHAEPAETIRAAGDAIFRTLADLDRRYRRGAGYDGPRLLEDRARKYGRIGAWLEELPLELPRVEVVGG